MMQSVKSLAAQQQLKASPARLLLFSSISLILQQDNIHALCYVGMLLVECLQLVFYAIHSRYSFLWQSPVTTGLQYVLKFLDSSGWLHQFPSLLLPFGIITLLLLIVFFLAAMRQGRLVVTNPRCNLTSFDQYILKTLNVLAVMFKTTLYMPLLYVSITMVRVNSTDAYYPMYLSLGIIGLLLFVTVQAIFNSFFVCSLPFHRHSLAIFNQYADAIKNIVKTLPPIYLAFDQNCRYAKEFLISMSLLLLVWCVLSLKLFEPYRRRQRMIAGVTPFVNLWIWLSVAYQSYNPTQTVGLFYTLVALPMVVVAWLALIHYRRRKMSQIRVCDLKTETDMVRFILEFIRNMEEVEDPQCRLWLKSAALEHYEKCTFTGCCCSRTISCFTNKLEVTAQDWYELLKDTVEAELLSRFESSCRLNLLLSYIQLCRIHNKYRSIYHINRIDDYDPGLFLQMQSHFFRSYIQHHIDHENRSANDNCSVDLQRLYDFHQGFSSFRRAIMESCERHVEFWKELQETHPEGIKLYGLCENINRQLASLKKNFVELQQINPNSLQLLTQYRDFLLSVRGVTDITLKQRIPQLAKHISRKSKSDHHRRPDNHYSQSTDTGIIVVSANENDLGQVQYVNCSVSETLGFAERELVGKKIDILIPEYLRKFHDEKMRQYIGSSVEMTQIKAKTVYMISRGGHITYMSNMVKTLSDISDGVALVGYFYELPIDKNYFICDEMGDIKGVSKGFSEQFGVPSNFRCNINTALSDFNLKDLVEGSSTPQTKKLAVVLENTTASVKRFEQNEWSVNIFLKEKRVLSEKNTLYLIIMTDSESKAVAEDNTQHPSLTRQQSIKDGSQLGDAEREIESSEKLYNETQGIIDSEQEPVRMRWLSRIGYISFLLMIVLASVALPLYYDRINKVQEQTDAIQTLRDLLMSIVDSTGEARRMQRLLRLNSTIPFTNDRYNSILNTSNNAFSRYTKFRQNMDIYGMPQSPSVPFWSFSPMFASKRSSVSLSAAIVQFQTASANLQNNSASNFNFSMALELLPLPMTDLEQNLVVMRYNSLYSIIPATIVIGAMIEQTYECLVMTCNYSSIIVLVVASVIIIGISILAVFTHLKISRIGLEVLGLLGFLENSNIHSNINDIVRYEQTHFGDMEIIHTLEHSLSSQSIAQGSNEIEKITTKQKGREPSITEPRISISNALDTQMGSNTRRSCIPSENEQLTSGSEASKKKSKKKIVDEKSKSVRQRQLELMNTRLAQGWRIVLKYTIFAIVLLAYFVSDFVLISQNLQKMLQSNHEYLLISQRSSYSNVIRYYSEESIYDINIFQDQANITSQLKGYISMLYETDRQVQQITPLSTFEQLVKKFDVNNVCQLFGQFAFFDQSNHLTYDECNTIHNRVFNDGLRGAFVTLADQSQSVYIKSNVTLESSMLALLQLPEFSEMLRLESYIRAVVNYQLSEYRNYLNSAVENQKTIFIGKLGVFLGVLLIMMVLIWRGLMGQMRSMVNNIKGLVLIMSFRKIQTIPSLKEEMIKSKVLQWFA